MAQGNQLEQKRRMGLPRGIQEVSQTFFLFFLSCCSPRYFSVHSRFLTAGWLTGCLGLNGCLVGRPSSKVMEAGRRDFPTTSSACNAVHCARAAARLGTWRSTVGRPCPAGRNPMPGNSQPLHRHLTSPNFLPVYHPFMRSMSVL